MTKRYWQVRGYDGLTPTFEKRVPAGYFSEGQIQELLRALAAKAGLSFDEIVGAYAKRNTKLANDLLSVQRDGPYPRFTCGTDPHFVARIVDEEGAEIGTARRDEREKSL